VRIVEDLASIGADLRARRSEIARAILSRLGDSSEPAVVGDAVYLDGFRRALFAAIDYGIASLESTDLDPPPIPTELLSQARLAARSEVGIDTVLRRYIVGHLVLGDFVIDTAARRKHLKRSSLRRLLRAESAIFDRVVSAVIDEYRREAARPGSNEQKRVERVRALIAGEAGDGAGLDYDFDADHVALVAVGTEALRAARRLLDAVNRDSLIVRPDDGWIWAWIGTRRHIEPSELFDLAVSAAGLSGVSIALGDQGRGPDGWRLTHRQAQAAMLVALRRPQPVTRYADIALVASTIRDEDLIGFLVRTYLLPLAEGHDDGKVLCETLRTFLAAGRNASAAGATLGITRQTVTTRLRTVEQRIGIPLERCGAEVETALRLAEIDPQLLAPGPRRVDDRLT
jgi:hypothetical protein